MEPYIRKRLGTKNIKQAIVRDIKNVLLYFEEEHSIKFCKKTLQNFLKKLGYSVFKKQAEQS